MPPRALVVAAIGAATAAAACGDHATTPRDGATTDAPGPADAARDAPPIDGAAAGWQCGPTGLVTPELPTAAFQLPTCHTQDANRPMFDDGAPRTWTDAVTGDARAACVFRPTDPAAPDTRPLVLLFHGAGQLAGAAMYDQTSLRGKAATFDLANDPSRLGFVLATDQGQSLDNPNSLGGGPTERHDVYYRDLASPSTNPDMRNADRLIDELVAEGGIDEARIYVMGWSNGGLFAQEYAVARHATPTPGGHRVAAAVSYVGPDPFENLSATQDPSCAYTPLPTTTVPIDLVHRTCDTVATCDPAQQAEFGTPPGFEMMGWLATLHGAMGDPNAIDTMYDASGSAATACAAVCDSSIGGANHTHWPDGVADHGGLDHEPELLGFLRDHPLSP